MDQALKNQPSVGTAQNWFAGAFGMRHEAGNVPRFVAEAGDVVEGTVRVGGFGRVALGIYIAPEDLVVCPERGQRFVIGEIAAFAVSDRNAQQVPGRKLVGERGFDGNRFQENVRSE